MWAKISSPPENCRFYKFTDNSNQHPSNSSRLEEQPYVIFQPDVRKHEVQSVMLSNKQAKVDKGIFSISHIQQERSKGKKSCANLQSRTNMQHTNVKGQGRTSNTKNKPIIANINKKEASNIFKFTSSAHSQNRHSINSNSKRQINSKAKQSAMKYQTSSNKKIPSNQINNEQDIEQSSFSQLLIKEIIKTEQYRQKGSLQRQPYFYEMMVTLQQIKNIEQQKLVNHREIVKMMDDKIKKEVHKQRKFRPFNQKGYVITQNQPNLEKRVRIAEYKLRHIEQQMQEQAIHRNIIPTDKGKKKRSSD